MSILDSFKKTIGGDEDDKKKKSERVIKKDKKEIEEKTKEVKKAAVKEIKKEKKVEKVEKKKKGKNIFGKKKKTEREDIPAEYYDILKEPHLTERATDLMKENKYVFKISSSANKIQVRKAVENLYGVLVTKVNVISIPRKKVRYGRGSGFKSGYRKAIVTLKEGDRIEMVEGV